MTLHLEIVTPERLAYSDDVDMVLVPGIEGELGILPRHTPLLTPLKTGEVMVRNDGVEENLFVSGGFLEVLPEKVVILADAAERAENIDQARAAAARKAAEERLAADSNDAQAAAKLERAIYRLKVVDVRRQHRGRSGHE